MATITFDLPDHIAAPLLALPAGERNHYALAALSGYEQASGVNVIPADEAALSAARLKAFLHNPRPVLSDEDLQMINGVVNEAREASLADFSV